MRKPLKITRIYLLSRALSDLCKPSPRVPVLSMKIASGVVVANTRAGIITASRHSNPSFNRAAPVCKLLTREGRRVEAIIGLSRGSGRS
ncbi:hypothetical protein [Pseudomonas sp. GM74]|uniref:hypothetical protein n=1 Tax=Pseudomonas sp. GM74 TaxID=1144336 RepID=UPI0009DB65CA|nr:hypothetical protein [Pseudomonas sp. GM74]